jgi:hypothetical protein
MSEIPLTDVDVLSTDDPPASIGEARGARPGTGNPARMKQSPG